MAGTRWDQMGSGFADRNKEWVNMNVLAETVGESEAEVNLVRGM